MKKVLNVFLVLVVMVALFFGGYYLSNYEDKKTKKTMANSNITTKEKNQKLDVNNSEVTRLFNRLNTIDDTMIALNISDDLYEDYAGYFYSKDKITSDKVSDEVKYIVSYMELGIEDEIKKLSISNQENYKIAKATIDAVSKKIFGYGIVNNINVLINNYAFKTDETYYTTEKKEKIESEAEVKVYTKIVSASKIGNTIETISKPCFELITFGDEHALYKNIDGNKSELYGLNNKITDLAVNENVNIDSYLSSLDSYKWVFTKNGDNYVFSSVEKIG